MKVSVIVPVYNVESYIVRCFDSISIQRYPSVECLFIDDASPDRSIELLEPLIASYKGDIVFRIIKHSYNRGLSAARNTGILNATGDYLLFVDSDDELPPQSLCALAEVALDNFSIEVVQGNTRTVGESDNGVDWRNISDKGFPRISKDKEWVRKVWYREPKMPTNAWNKLIKRDFLLCNNLFFKEGIIHEDELWMFYLLRKLSVIGFCEYNTYVHYVVKGSIMQNPNIEKSLTSWLNILQILTSELNSGLTSFELRYLAKKIKFNMLRLAVRMPEYNSYLKRYRSLIICLLKRIGLSRRFTFSLSVVIFLFPSRFYASWIGRKWSGLFIKLI